MDRFEADHADSFALSSLNDLHSSVLISADILRTRNESEGPVARELPVEEIGGLQQLDLENEI